MRPVAAAAQRQLLADKIAQLRKQAAELNAIANQPAELSHQINSEIDRWRRVIQASRIEA